MNISSTSSVKAIIATCLTFVMITAGVVTPLLRANAQQQEENPSGISVSPPFIEEKINPGDVYRGTFTVTNEDEEDRYYSLSKRDIEYLRDNGSPVFAPEGEKKKSGMAGFVQIFEPTIFVPAGAKREVVFAVVMPENVSPGSHYGAVMVSQKADGEGGEGGTTDTGGTLFIQYDIGVLLNFVVSGDIREEATLNEFSVAKRMNGDGEADFKVRVINKGNTLIRPRGPITITDMFGKDVTGPAPLIINDAGGAVLPQAERIFDVNWQAEGFAFGKYAARVGLSYGDVLKKTLTREITFWILPMKIVLPVIGAILLFGFLLFAFVRSAMRRKKRKVVRRKKKIVRKKPRQK